MTITEPQARALAYLLHDIRPDWGITSLLSLIDKHKDAVTIGPLTIAAMSKALEPSCKTPGPIFIPGPHWPEKARKTLPKPDPCEDHTGQEAHTCRSCWGDFKAGLRPQSMIGRHYTPQVIADALEASMEDT